MKKLNSTKSVPFIIARSVRDGKTTIFFTNGSKYFNQKLKYFTSLSTISAVLRCYAKTDWNSPVCSRCKFWLFSLVITQRYKVLVNPRRLMWRNFDSKAFADVATAWRHRGLSTFYIKHNLFHQSKLGRDVELQNTHIVIFKSIRGVMQVSTLSAQLGLGSELVDWYRDATSVPHSYLSVELSPRTEDRLHYGTNTRTRSLKVLYPGPNETIKTVGPWTHKISWLSKWSNHFATNVTAFSISLAQKSLSGSSVNGQ